MGKTFVFILHLYQVLQRIRMGMGITKHTNHWPSEMQIIDELLILFFADISRKPWVVLILFFPSCNQTGILDLCLRSFLYLWQSTQKKILTNAWLMRILKKGSNTASLYIVVYMCIHNQQHIDIVRLQSLCAQNIDLWLLHQ